MSEWIKCSKKTMPDAAFDAVAIICKVGEQRSVSLGRWSKHKRSWLNVNYQPMPDWFVTHWCPLPEPPHD